MDKEASKVGLEISVHAAWDQMFKRTCRVNSLSLVPCIVTIKSFQNHDKSINATFTASLKAYLDKSPKYTRLNSMGMSEQTKEQTPINLFVDSECNTGDTDHNAG